MPRSLTIRLAFQESRGKGTRDVHVTITTLNFLDFVVSSLISDPRHRIVVGSAL